MFRKNFWLKPALYLLPVLLLSALLAGCPGPLDEDPEPEPAALPLPNGWYKGSVLSPFDDGYGIEDDVLTYYDNGEKSVAFAGTVEYYDDDVAIVKITEGGSWKKSVGKYYGVYIGGVTPFSFSGASAYKADGNNDGMDTLDEAIAEYTKDSGYFQVTYRAGYGLYAGTATITGTDSGLEVSWPAVPDATGYDVYYTAAATPPTSTTNAITANVSISGTTAAITGLTNGTSYNVWVRAKDASHTGAWVYQGSGTPAPEIPEGLAQYFQSLPWDAGFAYYDDGFAVDASAKTFYYYSDSTFDKKWGGPIVKIVPDSDAFVMIIKITEVTGEWTPPPATGKYFAAAYKNLTESSVNSNVAYKMVDGKNTGVDTIEEAETEYTVANGYFSYLASTSYYPHTTSAVTLATLQGDWAMDDTTEDYYIQIKGTKLTEWLDDGDGIYDTTDAEDTLGELGDIVDHTDTTQTSGVLYVKIIDSDVFTADKYIAVAWKNKTGSGVSFATGSTGYETLAAVKAALDNANNTSQFPDNSFNDYSK